MRSYIGRDVWRNWEEGEWWPFSLAGDSLQVSDASQPQVRRSAANLEADRRLYLRVADAVQRRSDGEVILKRNWPELALNFANTYFPPVTSTHASPQDRIPVARFGHEALLVFWAIRLKAALAEAGGASKRRAGEVLFEALSATVQIQALESDIGGPLPIGPVKARPKQEGRPTARVRHYLRPTECRVNHDRYLDVDPRLWISLFAPKLRQADAEKIMGIAAPRPRKGHVADGTSGLTYQEAQRRVRLLLKAYADDKQALWWLATHVLASLLNLRLTGAVLTCHATGRFADRLRGTIPQVSVGFLFLNPLARIWFGLWEDWRGTIYRPCEKCGQPFPVTQKTKRFCSAKCQASACSQRHRDRDKAARLAAKSKRKSGRTSRST